MNQQAANVVDLGAYRARRTRYAISTPSSAFGAAPAGHFMAIPVLLPVMIGWLPVWVPGLAVSDDAVDQ